MSTYTSRSREIAARLAVAVDAGLVAAGEVVKTEVKRRLAPGYTSGAFVTGHVLGSVTRTAVSVVGGVHVLHVGTNVDYALFWEVGHANVFTRKFEHQPRWAPAVAAVRAEALRAFQIAAGLEMRAA